MLLSRCLAPAHFTFRFAQRSSPTQLQVRSARCSLQEKSFNSEKRLGNVLSKDGTDGYRVRNAY